LAKQRADLKSTGLGKQVLFTYNFVYNLIKRIPIEFALGAIKQSLLKKNQLFIFHLVYMHLYLYFF